MLEFYRWLQSAEGGIAGGATNSWKGRYEQPPAGLPTFYSMPYDASPVFQDPPSNDWFGFQVWSMERVAEYYYITGDPKAKLIVEKWVKWAKDNTELLPDGGYKIPSTMKWSGQPGSNWDAQNQNFDPADQNFNSGLHVEIVSKTEDVGTTAGLVHTLAFYAAKASDKDVQKLAKELLDRMWTKFRDDKGVTTPEVLTSFSRFNEKVFVPPNWKGKMPNGDVIEPGATFLSLRTKYKQDPSWPQVEAYLKGGAPPEFRYHRFWAQAHLALAYATYGWLFPETAAEKAPEKAPKKG
jgi:hypothetical protein